MTVLQLGIATENFLGSVGRFGTVMTNTERSSRYFTHVDLRNISWYTRRQDT